MIRIYSGRPGTGKTFLMTLHAFLQWLHGRTIYSNYKLTFEKWIPKKWKKEVGKIIYYNDIKSVLNGEITNALILIDEAQIYLNSRNWEVMTNEVQYALQQHRHDGLDIYGTTQHISRIDVVMRCLVQELFEVNHFWKIFWWISVDTNQLGTGNTDMLERSFGGIEYRGKDVLYNTYEKLDFPKKKTIEHVFSKCEECGTEKKIY